LGSANTLTAQYADTTGIYKFFPDQNDQMLQLPLQAKEQPLERPIDPDVYVVGPGDQLMLSIWGTLEFSQMVPVMPQGEIIVPTVGTITVRDHTVTEVQQLVGERVQTMYPASTVTISLLRLRTIIVHVVGEVFQPGNLSATPADRVSNLLTLAGGTTTWADSRKIEIRHLDGTTDTFNYMEYLRSGAMEGNVELQGGDIIQVPRHSFARGTVYLEGNVALPGHYPVYENENLGSLLQRGMVRRENTDWENAFIQRVGANGQTDMTRIPLNFSQPQGQSAADEFLLLPGDQVFLPRRIDQVYVVGTVRTPGPYPYHPNYRAIDYVGMAGQREDSDSASRFRVTRRETQEIEEGGDVLIERGDIIEVRTKRSRKFQQFVQVTGPISSFIIAVVAVMSLSSN